MKNLSGKVEPSFHIKNSTSLILKNSTSYKDPARTYNSTNITNEHIAGKSQSTFNTKEENRAILVSEISLFPPSLFSTISTINESTPSLITTKTFSSESVNRSDSEPTTNKTSHQLSPLAIEFAPIITPSGTQSQSSTTISTHINNDFNAHDKAKDTILSVQPLELRTSQLLTSNKKEQPGPPSLKTILNRPNTEKALAHTILHKCQSDIIHFKIPKSIAENKSATTSCSFSKSNSSTVSKQNTSVSLAAHVFPSKNRSKTSSPNYK
jgi:hypothetical protein